MVLEKISSRRILSFKYAFAGIITALKEEPNLKFHFLAGLLVVVLAIVLKISTIDWIIIIFLIGFVTSVELTNTAIEAVVDAFTDQEHPRAKIAKDISAGAVLIAAITSFIIGAMIFLPYLLQWTT
ncbi:MAG: diacylglycerol kinase family protein [Candidatus Daviesbacteria bacterium]|nr:diacylglycerol kinase family protein [Candidatus Daviesbacteria bacterium]